MRKVVGVMTFMFTALALAPLAQAQQAAVGTTVADHLVMGDLIATAVYGLLGLFLALVGYKLFDLITPFSLTKELVEDQNLAIGIVVGAMFLGTSIIVASAIL